MLPPLRPTLRHFVPCLAPLGHLTAFIRLRFAPPKSFPSETTSYVCSRYMKFCIEIKKEEQIMIKSVWKVVGNFLQFHY
jgi:hypothetical protein